VLIVMIIVRCLQLILGAIGALFAALTVFVMLNFPSSGVSVQAPMLPTFWHVLNRFWIGASASDAFRSILYFGGQGVGTDVLKLLGWLAVGAVLLALVAVRKLQHERQRHEVAPLERPAEQPAVQLRPDPRLTAAVLRRIRSSWALSLNYIRWRKLLLAMLKVSAKVNETAEILGLTE
jgi:hypothetical protein